MYDKAEKDYKKILDIDNKNVNAMLSLSVHYIRNKSYLNAESYAKRATKLNPDSDDAHLLLGRSQQYQGLFTDAIKSFKTSISLNSDNSDSYYYLGLIYLRLEDSRNACKNLAISSSLENSKAKKVLRDYCK